LRAFRGFANKKKKIRNKIRCVAKEKSMNKKNEAIFCVCILKK
jgi:hypothetical protein